ncbi:MAG: hypothetical protein VW455_01765 [Nitrospinota bacterium]
MSKPDMEKLEAGVSTLLEAYRRLKEQNESLAGQVEGLKRESESLLKEKEFVKEKLERLAELESETRKDQADREKIREKVVQLLEKLDRFDLT